MEEVSFGNNKLEKLQKDPWKTGFVWSEFYMWHDTGMALESIEIDPHHYFQPIEHVEGPEAKRRIKNLLDATGLIDELHLIKPSPAKIEDILRFHTKEYISKIQNDSKNLLRSDAGEEAPYAKGAFDIAALSTGGCLRAFDSIMSGSCKNAYALVRPPGHHAERNRGRGFCMLNNIAITALYAMEKHKFQRIAIVDWDVHHGNGTQQAFWDDPRVLFVSVHQDRNYPCDSGLLDENGEGKGEGYTINIPLPPGSASEAYQRTFDRVIVPALDAFKPEFIMISCGFDPACYDPLGRMMLHSDDFRSFTKRMMKLADTHSQGRLLVVHEGGYSRTMAPFCGLAVIEQLSQIKTEAKDPFIPVVTTLGGRELNSHQTGVITKAEALVDKLKSKINR